MPTYRKLHTKILDSYDFAEMPDDFARVVWMLMPLIQDSEGRGIYNMAWVRSKMFPLRPDISLEALSAAFEWFIERGMVIIYTVDGKTYFYTPTFKNYQTGTEREARSVLPAPQEVLSRSREGQELVEVAATATAYESVSESVSVNTRPNVFSIYEKEIGMLTPMIGEKLELAEREYPPGWVEDAIKESATHNARSWAYAEKILQRWKVDGHAPPNGSKAMGKRQTGTVMIEVPGVGTVEAKR